MTFVATSYRPTVENTKAADGRVCEIFDIEYIFERYFFEASSGEG